MEVSIPSYFKSEETKSEHIIEVEERQNLNTEVPSFARRLASHHYWYNDGSLTVRYPTTPTGKPMAVQINGLTENVTRLVYTPAFRQNTDFQALFEGMLTMKLLDAGVALIHAGAVVNSGSATVLTSMGRMGKTSSLLTLLSEDSGQGFMGDNILLLDSRGTVYSWPATLGVFPGTAIADEQLPESTRLRVMVKRLIAKSNLLSAALLHKFSIDLSENLAPEAVSDELVDEAPISRIYLLNGGRLDREGRTLTHTEAAAKIATGTDMELNPQNYYLSLYAFAADSERIHPSVVKRRRETIIRNAVEDVKVKELFANSVSGYVDSI